jgi:hypothetical protein
VVGTQSEDGPSPGAPQRQPRQGFAFRLARRLALPQAQHVLQYAAAGVIPIDKDKYILLLIILSDIQHGMQKNQFKSSLTLEMELDQLPDKRYCSGLRVSADRDANRAAHTLAKAAVLDLQRPGLCETLTLRWRRADSNP